MDPALLKKSISKAPQKPGVYLFLGKNKKYLYVGKATNIKTRLLSYLRVSDLRLEKMIKNAKLLETRPTETEIEALILESQLIKIYHPQFNIVLRDDKQYFYVGFSKEEFPRLFVTHQPTNVSSIKYQVSKKDKMLNTKYIIPNTDYIGPFTDGTALKTALRFLRRLFPYCTCKQKHTIFCLNYHIGKCLGVCCLKSPGPDIQSQKREYLKNLKIIKDLMSGKRKSLVKSLEEEMKKLADQERFEEAIRLKEKIEKPKLVFENAKIISSSGETSKMLDQLKAVFGLSNTPKRIEGYDISNIQGRFAVGSMIVFQNGKPDKDGYRKFKIRYTASGGDTAMLAEVVQRRFTHTEWPFPDLIVVDGGKAQVNAVKKNAPGNTPVIGLTKGPSHSGVAVSIPGQTKPISLTSLPKEAKNILLRVGDEAHRFAISYYRHKHKKEILG